MDEQIHTPEDGIDDIADLYLSKTGDDKEEDEDKDEAEESQEDQEDVEESADDEGEGDEDASEEDDEAEPKAKVADDDATVSVTVNGEAKTFKVADLKRLAGQEAALTQRSQAVADRVRQVEAQGLYLASILDARYKAAQAQYEKYAKIDLFKAHRELDPEDFDSLRAAKQAAEAEFQTITREAQQFVQRAQATRVNLLRSQAQDSLKTITKAIPDWTDETYAKVRSYAVSQGMDANTVNEIVDASAVIMMHKAMQYDALSQKKATVEKKVAKAPQTVMKKSSNAADATSSKVKAARARAAASGDIDDVAALFEAALKAKD